MTDKKPREQVCAEDDALKDAKAIKVGTATLYVRREVGETFDRIERALQASPHSSKSKMT